MNFLKTLVLILILFIFSACASSSQGSGKTTFTTTKKGGYSQSANGVQQYKRWLNSKSF
jgi:hypothetical protein